MSFILDALKKSELERQRQTIPGLMDAGPPARRPRFPLWAVALVVLLGVNLAVLLVVLLRSTPSSTRAVPAMEAPSASRPVSSLPAPPVVSATPAVSAPAVSGPSASAPAEALATAAPQAVESSSALPPSRSNKHFSPLDATPVYAPEIPADDDAAAATARSERASDAAKSATLAGTPPAGGSPVRGAHARDPVLTPDEDKGEEEALPTIGEIDLSGQPALPDLHLDVHVFAPKPADRFVYIDNRKYREGSALADGLTLERIRRDGVVLNYHGLRFVLPRQQ